MGRTNEDERFALIANGAFTQVFHDSSIPVFEWGEAVLSPPQGGRALVFLG